jgi:hypothetical protein
MEIKMDHIEYKDAKCCASCKFVQYSEYSQLNILKCKIDEQLLTTHATFICVKYEWNSDYGEPNFLQENGENK